MIVSEHEQGTEGWRLDRMAIPTASGFNKIVTSTGAPSSQANGYMNDLLEEWVTGVPLETYSGSKWMENGKEQEPEARSTYEFMTGNKVQQTGLIYLDERKLIGASPDGLTGTDGCNEYKCVKASTMLKYVTDNKLPTSYKQQVQGEIWVSEREWCDFFAYHRNLKPFMIRVYRDDRYIKQLSEAVECFVEEMLEKREKLSGLMAR